MNLLTVFAQHEVNEIMKATDHTKLTQSHVDSVIQRSVDFAIEKFNQKDALEKLERLLEAGTIAQYQVIEIGPLTLVAACGGFQDSDKMTAAPLKVSHSSKEIKKADLATVACHVGIFEKNMRGGFAFVKQARYGTVINETGVNMSGVLKIAVEELERNDREKIRGHRIERDFQTVEIRRPKFKKSLIVDGGQHDMADLVRESTAIQMMEQVEDEAHHTLITTADRIMGGILVEYEREIVRVATHARTGLTQMRSNLRGRVEELIANANTASPINNGWWGSW